MTSNVPDTIAEPNDAHFHARGRTLQSGRGWDWIVEAFALFRKQPGLWILLTVVLGVIFIVVSLIPVLGSLANALLFPLFGAGLMLGCRDLEQGNSLEISHLFLGFKRNTSDLVLVGVFNLLGWVVIALAVIAVVGAGVFLAMLRGGTPGASLSLLSILIAMLLVAALSVPLYMATWFAPALIILHELAPVAALKASFYACLRNWIPFLIYGLAMLVLGVLAAIPAGLGFLVLVPVLAASVYTAYRDIFRAAQ